MNSRTQDSMTDAVTQARDVSISVMSSVFDAVTRSVPDLPEGASAAGLPQPKQLTGNALEFALTIYKIQSDYAVRTAEILQRLATRTSEAVAPFVSKVAGLRAAST